MKKKKEEEGRKEKRGEEKRRGKKKGKKSGFGDILVNAFPSCEVKLSLHPPRTERLKMRMQRTVSNPRTCLTYEAEFPLNDKNLH